MKKTIFILALVTTTIQASRYYEFDYYDEIPHTKRAPNENEIKAYNLAIDNLHNSVEKIISIIQKINDNLDDKTKLKYITQKGVNDFYFGITITGRDRLKQLGYEKEDESLNSLELSLLLGRERVRTLMEECSFENIH